MAKATRATRYLRAAMLAVALALPLSSLLVLGSVWLWQQGYLIHWAIAAALTTLTAFLVERWLLRDAVAEAGRSREPEFVPDPLWHGRELAAWDEVAKIADKVDVSTLDSRDAVLALGVTTIDAVSRRMHPGHREPLLKFTVPEALALVERVSGQLGPFVRESIPLGDRLTVGQFVTMYRWRSMLDVAEKAYDLWRVIRLMNPAAAVAQELRENVTRQIYEWGREELARRLAKAYVREVGAAAIELYSGRLKTSTKALSGVLTEATLADLARQGGTAEPLRIVVAGESSAASQSILGSLRRALERADWLNDSRGEIGRSAAGPSAAAPADTALFIDATALADEAEALSEAMSEADLIVWLSTGVAERLAGERAVLDRMRSALAADVMRRPPPMVAAAVDVGTDLGAVATALDLPADGVVHVSQTDGVEQLVERIRASLAAARRTRVTRLIRAAATGNRLSQLWSQARNVGRVVIRSIGRR